MVWVIAFGELFFGDLWCVVWGYGGMRTHFSLLNPEVPFEIALVVGGRVSSAFVLSANLYRLQLVSPHRGRILKCRCAS
jgi:hypothetical protein